MKQLSILAAAVAFGFALAHAPSLLVPEVSAKPPAGPAGSKQAKPSASATKPSDWVPDKRAEWLAVVKANVPSMLCACRQGPAWRREVGSTVAFVDGDAVGIACNVPKFNASTGGPSGGGKCSDFILLNKAKKSPF